MNEILQHLNAAEALAIKAVEAQQAAFDKGCRDHIAAGALGKLNPGRHRMLLAQIRDARFRVTQITDATSSQSGGGVPPLSRSRDGSATSNP